MTASPARLRLLGALVIVALAAVAVIGIARPNPLADTVTVRAVFDDAARLAGRIDRNVRIGGVNVGEIGKTTRLGDDALVELELAADKAGHIAADARAELRPHTLFEGSSFIEVYPGSAGAAPLGERAIPRARTRNYVTTGELLRVAQPRTRQALARDVRDLATALRPSAPRGVQRMLRNLPPLYGDLGAAARASRGVRGGELAGAVRGLSRTVAALGASERDLAPLLRGGDRMLAAFNTDDGAALAATLEGSPAALDAMVRGGRRLERILDRLDPLSVDLRPALVAAAPALRELRPLLHELRPVARDTGPFLDDLRAALDGGARSVAPTRDLLGDLRRAFEMLDLKILPTLRGNAPSFGVPVYQLATRSVAVSGSASLAGLVTEEQSRANGNFGAGKMNRFAGEFFAATGAPEQSCHGIDARVRDEFRRLGLCDNRGGKLHPERLLTRPRR